MDQTFPLGDDHYNDLKHNNQAEHEGPPLTCDPYTLNLIDGNNGFETINYDDSTFMDKHFSCHGSRLQACDLVEVQSIEIPMAFTKSSWSGPNLITPAGNKNVMEEGIQGNINSISLAEAPTSTVDVERNDGNAQGENDGRKCQICSDVASGFHYGVWSCEGCKAFFKRSLQGPVDYVCPATNTCTIDKQRRKACQACRLRKCIEMGMTRGNCRPEKHSAEDNHQSTTDAPPRKKRMSSQQKAKKEQETTAPTAPAVPSMDSQKNCVQHPLLERLILIETPVFLSDHDNNLPDNEVSILNSILRLGGKELMHVIHWAKSVPGYLDLPLPDRISLLECCWIEILVCDLVWRSMPYATQDTLYFASDLVMDRVRCINANIWPEAIRLITISRTMAELQLTKEEFVLFKATVLMNAEIVSTDTEMILKRNRDYVMQAWYAHCDPRRVCQILLLLPHIRQVSLHSLGKMFELRSEQIVSFSDLQRELLEARFAPGNVSAYIRTVSYPNSQLVTPISSPPGELANDECTTINGSTYVKPEKEYMLHNVDKSV